MVPLSLSSNWKRLQTTLSHDKPTTATQSSPPLKRKRTPAVSSKHHTSTTTAPASFKRRKMSSTALAPPVPPPTELNIGLHPTHQPGRYLGMDCEMVTTTLSDSRLARISIVNYLGQIVYDSFVLPSPSDPVIDYKTNVSGIRARDLRPGYARPIESVREEVVALLNGRVLVGHALRNDLQALGLGHPGYAIRDTARHAAYRVWAAGRTPSLRLLAEKVLGLAIQDGEHDSVVDARTAMELYKADKGRIEDEVRKKYGALVGRKGPEVLKGKIASKGVRAESVDEDDSAEVGTLDGESEAEVDVEDEADEDTAEVGTDALPSASKKKRKKKRKHKSRTTRA